MLYDSPVEDPRQLSGYDVVLWSAGRRSLNEASTER